MDRESFPDRPDSNQELAMYGELASWWPLLSAPADYHEEAVFYLKALLEHCAAPPTSLLELGSGGGNNAWHMKSAFEHVTLVDRSSGMLRVSRVLNPDLEHVEGDMRTVRLGRTFDSVFIHDAVCYMRSVEELTRAVETAWVHLNPGGVALLAPDHVKETFEPSTDCGGHDDGTRGLRYLEWTWDPDPDDQEYQTEYAYLRRLESGEVTVTRDRHVCGLFPRATWLEVLHARGFDIRQLAFDHSEVDRPLHVFVGVRPER